MQLVQCHVQGQTFQLFCCEAPCHENGPRAECTRREYLALMDEDQIDRYEAFRRSSLQKASMRKVIACPIWCM